MEKRRVKLMVNGMPVTLLTDETDEYMRSLAKEVETEIRQVATPYGPAERPAVLTALTLCDRAFRAEREVQRLREELAARENELQVETGRTRVLRASLDRLEGQEAAQGEAPAFAEHRNPFRAQDAPQQGLQSFFEIDDEDGTEHHDKS